MKESFLDLLEGLHCWCVADQGPELPAQLVQSQNWLATHLPAAPTTLDDWISLWRRPLAEWWPTSLPDGWPPHASLLSRREATLTVAALTMLQAQRPGVIAVVLPPPPRLPPLTDAPPLSRAEPDSAPPQWNLQDLVTCVIREVSRRERVYPQLVHQQRLAPEEAQRELSQMRAVKSYLLSKLQEGAIHQQQVLF